MFKTILVALDGSRPGQAALRLALDMGKRCDAEVKALHVPHVVGDVVMAGTMPIHYPAAPSLIEEAVSHVRASMIPIARELGLQAPELIVRSGDPTQEVLRAIEEVNADLLVMGRRGLGNVSGLLLGSVTQKVQARAACPVLTVV
ncbi:MAG: universal stress protein [Pseudomonadota bacterium]